MAWENIQDIKYNSDSNLILCSMTTGLLELSLDASADEKILAVNRFDQASGLITNYLKCVYFDHENNTWIGTMVMVC